MILVNEMNFLACGNPQSVASIFFPRQFCIWGLTFSAANKGIFLPVTQKIHIVHPHRTKPMPPYQPLYKKKQSPKATQKAP